MQSAFIFAAVLFVLGSIGLVVAHLSGVVDPTKYEFMRGVLPVAYVVSILTAGAIAAGATEALFKK